MSSPTSIEKSNLEAHVELCSQRYNALEARLSSVEEKLGKLQQTIEASSLNTVKVLIGTGGTIIVAILSLFGVMLSKLG